MYKTGGLERAYWNEGFKYKSTRSVVSTARKGVIFRVLGGHCLWDWNSPVKQVLKCVLFFLDR